MRWTLLLLLIIAAAALHAWLPAAMPKTGPTKAAADPGPPISAAGSRDRESNGQPIARASLNGGDVVLDHGSGW